MTVYVDIHLEVTGEPSGLEAAILNALADKRRGGVEVRFKDGLAEEVGEKAAETVQPKKRGRGRPRKTAAAEEPKTEEPKTEEPKTEEPKTEEVDETEYRQKVVKKALELAAGSHRALVRKAVNEVGGKRVSTLTLEQLKEFDRIVTEAAEN